MTDWNGFKGHAKRLDDIDLPRLGARLGVGEDPIHMFLDVETTGSGFLPNGEVKKLFERHKFYSELKHDPEKLNRAIRAGLANKRAGGYGKESEQAAKIIRAIEIDETAALRATSWGIGQVMGFNHKTAGYDTPQAMVKAFMDDEENQLEGAVNFILGNHLDDELRKCKPGDPDSCRAFASGYNGSDYQRNNYHVKMATALLKWSRIKDTPYPPQKPAEAASQPKSGGKTNTVAAGGVGVALVALLAAFWDKISDVLGLPWW